MPTMLKLFNPGCSRVKPRTAHGCIIAILLSLVIVLSACHSASPANLIANGDFEVDDFGRINNWFEVHQIDLSRWYLVQDIPPGKGAENVRWIERIDLSAEGHGYGLKSTDYQNCDFFCCVEAVQLVAAYPGKTYLLAADLRTEQGISGDLYLDFLNANRVRIEVHTASGGGDAWTTLTVSGEAPKGTQYVRIILYSGNSTQGVIYWDNVTLRSP